MIKPLLLLVLLALYPTKGQACLNEYYSVDHTGALHKAEEWQEAFNKNFNPRLIERRLIKLFKELEKDGDYRRLSDYAVLLLKGGKTKSALAIFQELASHYPQDYALAANLGTALEIDGQLVAALAQIQRGIALNPDAHEASEWVHERILQVKIQLMTNPEFLDGRTVLALSRVEKDDPAVRDQLLLQIRERFPFSPGPNMIMASLLFDLGDCFAQTSSIEYAKSLYTISKNYFGGDADLAKKKINEMVSLRRQYKDVQPKRNIREVTNIKLEGIRYKDLLDDNNPSGRQLNWGTISSNADELLALVNLPEPVSVSATVPEEHLPGPAIDTVIKEYVPQVIGTPEKNFSWLISFVTLAFILAGLAWWRLK